jgi:serine O-acetyltransferase
MIKSKEDLKRYLESDKRELAIKHNRPKIFSDEVWKFERALRYREYHYNMGKSILHKIMYKYYTLKYHHWSVKLGYYLPMNVCDEGLHINHFGMLIINDNAKIGKNFNVHQGVNIGVNINPAKAPVIGDNVFVGPGSKIYGDIKIADNIAIAAGSVVNTSFETPNITIGGVPAKVLNDKRGNPFV